LHGPSSSRVLRHLQGHSGKPESEKKNQYRKEREMYALDTFNGLGPPPRGVIGRRGLVLRGVDHNFPKGRNSHTAREKRQKSTHLHGRQLYRKESPSRPSRPWRTEGGWREERRREGRSM
jgi:hypothetical protein